MKMFQQNNYMNTKADAKLLELSVCTRKHTTVSFIWGCLGIAHVSLSYVHVYDQ